MNNNVIFDINDYQSGDGMLTSIWGPALWHFLHTMSFNYPVQPTKQDKINYRNFILSLKDILPCRYCRENLKKNLKTLPITMKVMKSRYTFSYYIYELHELINTMLNKKSGLTYEQVRETYEHFRSRCNSSSNKRKTRKKKSKEKGCTTPLKGVKSKCLIRIVPSTSKNKTFKVEPSCFTRRLY